MRIFIGIKAGESLKNRAFEIQRKYRHLNVRWADFSNLHTTLIPPWDVENSEEVERLLEPLERFRRFEINFEKLEFGPNLSKPRLIWAKGKSSEEFIALRKELENVLEQKSPHDPGECHFTLARLKTGSVKGNEINEEINWNEKAVSIVLYESHLKQHGAKYNILKEIELS